MFFKFLKSIFGSANDRILKKLYKEMEKINALEPKISALNDDDLKAQTEKLKELFRQGDTLDELLPEAFATVREASKRTIGMRHYDVQLIGGIALHKGMIAEMHTGEGKTMIAPLAAYLNALAGGSVHIVTANDYLAKRDAQWMGKIYQFLGMSVGCVIHGVSEEERKNAYDADITHGTNNEFGFDYLRDNMKFHASKMVQRTFSYAIIDEVDSILIDEARTPLIISGPTDDNTSLYYQVNQLIPEFGEIDYVIDEKTKSIFLSEAGSLKAEKLLCDAGLVEKESSLYDMHNLIVLHHINQALKAHFLFKKDIDYMVKDAEVMIIDEFTGRAMEGRRYSDGLHQAIEAKENVPVHNENQTLASITYQNYFRMYPKLSGMTGTAATEADEFFDIYKLDVLQIPTNKKMVRIDEDDEIYATTTEKYKAIVKEIVEAHAKDQPILIGTISIEKSEYLSKLLQTHNIKHQVLNAKFHEHEAKIIAQAGVPGSVTIATNMAGRGTDIKLGGSSEFLISEGVTPEKAFALVETNKQIAIEAGGLYVIGTERHESRRIDNQLRGRSGRQGDPGRSKFYLSLEDDLMRIFASDRISLILKTLGLKDGEAIYHPMISKALERAQKKVEGFNYEIRKNLLKFDDVASQQRKIIYEQRRDILDGQSTEEMSKNIINDYIEDFISEKFGSENHLEEDETENLIKEVQRLFGNNFAEEDRNTEKNLSKEDWLKTIKEFAEQILNAKIEKYGDAYKMAERKCLLMTLDQCWKEHLHFLDTLRHGINLRAMGQKDPLNEYKREAFQAFNLMLAQFHENIVERMMHMELGMVETEQGDMLIDNMFSNRHIFESRIDPALSTDNKETNLGQNQGTIRRNIQPEARDKTDPSNWGRVQRNEACPCGSSKKYKHCHGAFTKTEDE